MEITLKELKTIREKAVKNLEMATANNNKRRMADFKEHLERIDREISRLEVKELPIDLKESYGNKVIITSNVSLGNVWKDNTQSYKMQGTKRVFVKVLGVKYYLDEMEYTGKEWHTSKGIGINEETGKAEYREKEYFYHTFKLTIK